MDIQTLIRRAQAAGLRVDVSGPIYFIHGRPRDDGKPGLTIRIQNGKISRSDDKDQTMPRAISANEASKALRLPRRD
jgi:hypothetical protein